jgi:hypothetical protein
MVVALFALFLSLGGVAVAAGVVPLAKRALVADNAKKLGGKTPAQLQPGTVAGLVALRSANWSLSPGQADAFTAPCANREKVVGGGYDHASGDVLALDSRPAPDATGWKVNLESLSPTSAAAGAVYAICVR